MASFQSSSSSGNQENCPKLDSAEDSKQTDHQDKNNEKIEVLRPSIEPNETPTKENNSPTETVDFSFSTTSTLRTRNPHPNRAKKRLASESVELDDSDQSTLSKPIQESNEKPEKPDPDHEESEHDVRRILERNPHLRQNPKALAEQLPINSFDRNHRILARNAPRKEYFVRPYDTRSTLHWGQRKLLFSEIEFLTQFGSPKHLVLYAGAAPGTHITYLSSLFPDYHFVLVDPAPFECKESSKIKIINNYFTDTIAKQYEHDDVLFISDIRTADYRSMESDETERFIEADQLDQMRWVKILRPHKAMLKFRLPYQPGSSMYLDGELFLPVWGPQSTTETRLVPFSPDAMRRYDHTEYEQQMFYFNTTTRSLFHEHSVDFEEGDGLDHCFDCMSEIFILRNYLNKFGKDSSDRTVVKMSKEISLSLSNTRTIKNSPLRMEHGFDKRADQHRAWRNGQLPRKWRRTR